MAHHHNQSIRQMRAGAPAVAECLEPRRLLSVDPLDPTFGTLGVVRTQFSAPQSYAFAMALDANGKALIVGEQAGLSGAPNQFPLMRFNPDGTPDNSFGTGGRALPNPDPARRFSVVSDVAVLPGGKILAAGTPSGNNRPLAIARYNAHGTPDLSFGTSGVVFRQQGAFVLDAQLAVQADGKIVVGARVSGALTFFRFNADGSLDDGLVADTTPGDRFGAAGTFVFDPEGFVLDLELQPDGKIVAAGWVYDPAAEYHPRMTVFRLNTDGTPDASFDGDGKVTLLPPASFAPKHNGLAYDLVMRPDGRLLVGGIQQPVVGFSINPGNFVVYALNANGSADTTFGGAAAAGRVSTSFEAEVSQAHQSAIYSLVLRPDGVLIAGGTVSGGTPGNLTDYAAMVAYRADGTLERSFGTNGKLVSPTARLVQDVALQADGRLLAFADGVFPEMVLARYFTDPVVKVRTASIPAVTTEINIPPAPFQTPYGSVGTFVIERGGDIGDPLTVPLLTVGSTATSGLDYESLPTSVTFAANQDSISLPVAALDDYLLEGDETVILRPAVPSGYVDASTGVPVTIRDNEGPDRFEPNNTLDNPSVPAFGGRASIPRLSIHSPTDVDVFKFTMPTAGQFLARITFRDDLGDLRLELYDEQEVLLAISDGTGDVEQVTTDVLAGTTVYVRVLGARRKSGGPGGPSATANPDYDLVAMVQPTVDIVDITPDPRNSPVPTAVIQFTARVTGLDLLDLVLSRDGGPNLLTDAQTLTTADGGRTWTLGNLSGPTAVVGRYVLTLPATGSGIVDASTGAGLIGDDFDAWVNAPARRQFLSGTSDPAITGQSNLLAFDGSISASSRLNSLRLVNGLTNETIDLTELS